MTQTITAVSEQNRAPAEQQVSGLNSIAEQTPTMKRLLVVHAHPDDESIMTGGTIAQYAAAGVEVTVLTCTLGEEGEVIGTRLSQLVSTQADQLGGYRMSELTEALVALSPPAKADLVPRFLGGAGHWRDSGMAGTETLRNPRAFAAVQTNLPAQALAEVICYLKPQVVIGYDPKGTYGHPDHLQVHRIAALALDLAEQNPVSPWVVQKYYWSVVAASALQSGLADAAFRVPPDWIMPEVSELPSYPDEEITTEIDVRPVIWQKVRALAAHTTQVIVSPSKTEFALSNLILQPIFDHEHYILARGKLGPLDDNGRETDLFGGLL